MDAFITVFKALCIALPKRFNPSFVAWKYHSSYNFKE